MTDFEGVVPALASALTKRGYTELTQVQLACIAPELVGRDALVSAQTGSGKTVAFGMALASTVLDENDRFPREKAPVTLAVAPTRELALQVMRELEWLYAETGAKVVSCVGGMDMRTERRNLAQGANIVVGTPGRLRDHIERGSFDTSCLKAVVLDEADEMLDLGFRDDLEYILDAAPENRRTLMFSATVPRQILGLAKRFQNDAVRVATVAEQGQHLDIEYQALTVAPNDRENAIINVLRYFDAKNAIVFCGTRAMVNHLTSRFNNRGFSVVALSGELSQNERSHALQAMRDGRAKVCIATDVAARGIDLPNLELVVHADIPKNREGLLHRSGRTGRAGRKGTSVLIVPHNARRKTERLLSNANIEAKWAKPPSVDDIVKRDRERLMADPMLIDPLTDDETAFATQVLAVHSPEQIAAAFLRLHSLGNPAPEELLDNAPFEEQQKSREDFKNGVWFSLSVGRNDNAEARWLLPMLCRAGHMTKNDIGAIRIQPDETYVELSAGCVDKFVESVGPNGKMEKNVTITRLDSMPAGAMGGGGGRKPFAKKPFNKGGKKFDSESGGGKPWEKRKSAGHGGSDGGKPWEKRKSSGDAKPWDKKKKPDSNAVKPWDKDKPKSQGAPGLTADGKPRKPHKKKLARAAARAATESAAGKGKPDGGSTPLKRKKPSK